MAHPTMALAAGTRLGPYAIEASIGAGGMGEVYRARDTRLDRTVAVKVMPAHIAARAELRERFEREARTVAGLKHPHICVLHDIGRHDGVDFIVLEHLEGETLEARLGKGALSLQLALDYATQIADALDRAHRNGIVHRDVKPSNVMLTRDGVKVLDFGLATRRSTPAENDETHPASLTDEGSVLGTAQYMAPEVYEGQDADVRSDVFGFGCVLYEMVTGTRAFGGKTRASVIAAVLGTEPQPIKALNPLTPSSVEKVVRRCLAKDPENRYQSLRDVLLELRSVDDAPDAPIQPTRSRLWPAVAALLTVVLAGVSVVYFRERPPESGAVRLSLAPPENAGFSLNAGVPGFQVSPDGRQIVFAAAGSDSRSQLWLHSLDSAAARPLPGTETASSPFWSPDGKSIGFFAGAKLKRIDPGSPTVVLADAPDARGGAWNDDGVIVFAPNVSGPLHRVHASGGAVSVVTALDAKGGEISHRFPWFLPDGQHFLYAASKAGATQVSIRIGSFDSTEQNPTLQVADSFALYSQGYLLFLRNTTLMARQFDERRLVFAGEAVPAAEQIQTGSNTGLGAFSVSANGVLLYAGRAAGDLRLAWFDRTGRRLEVLGDPGDIRSIHSSPDGKKVAVSIADSSTTDIWIYDVQRRVRTRFTFDPANDGNAVWSPNGHTIVFRSERKGPNNLYRRAADGSGGEQLLFADQFEKFPTSFSPDGKHLGYMTFGDPQTGADVWVLPDPLGPAGVSKPFPFIRSEFWELDPQFSPDGKWIAYASNESGRWEVYIAPFPGPGGKRQVSAAGGRAHRWRRDGRELFYFGLDHRLMAVGIDGTRGSLEIGKTEALVGGLIADRGYLYDVSPDGQRLLAAVRPENPPQKLLTVVLNWTAGLKR
jgi:serine/threonine protein kinase